MLVFASLSSLHLVDLPFTLPLGEGLEVTFRFTLQASANWHVNGMGLAVMLFISKSYFG